QYVVPGSAEVSRARNLLSPGLTPTGSSVTHFRRRCATLVAIAARALFHLGCGDGVGLPDEGVPTEIKAFSGDDQTGPAGGALAEPVVVRVTDRRGPPCA